MLLCSFCVMMPLHGSSVAKLGKSSSPVHPHRGRSQTVAMKGLKLSELKMQQALILVSSSLAQQCSEQQRGI